MKRFVKTLLFLFIIQFAFVILNSCDSSVESDPKVLQYYPENYEASRSRFREMSEQLGGALKGVETAIYDVPSLLGEDLTIDTLHIPAQEFPERLIVLVSGVHGPETYAGSAIQKMFMDEFIKTAKVDFVNTGIVMIHSMNPYGFKHHRRVTENNVNLNRNFSTSPTLFETENKNYLKIRDLLEPTSSVTADRIAALDNSTEVLSLLAGNEFTMDDLNEAIGSGQYEFEKGVEYGGTSFEPQVEFSRNYLCEIFKRYGKIFVADLHTGLGEANILHLISAEHGSSDELNSIFGEEAQKGSYQLTSGDSEGFYHVNGDFIDFVQEVNSETDVVPTPHLISVTAEFGTIGNGPISKLRTLNRLILENQGHFHGYSTEEVRERVEKRFLEMFYPNDPVWKTVVIQKSRIFFEQILKNF